MTNRFDKMFSNALNSKNPKEAIEKVKKATEKLNKQISELEQYQRIKLEKNASKGILVCDSEGRLLASFSEASDGSVARTCLNNRFYKIGKGQETTRLEIELGEA